MKLNYVYSVLAIGLAFPIFNYSKILSVILVCGGIFLLIKTGFQQIAKK